MNSVNQSKALNNTEEEADVYLISMTSNNEAKGTIEVKKRLQNKSKLLLIVYGFKKIETFP